MARSVSEARISQALVVALAGPSTVVTPRMPMAGEDWMRRAGSMRTKGRRFLPRKTRLHG
ncbi:hypothetical protein D9R08_02925 [Rhodophyticola porphyridii]|uniref:Uncharacterized protein n=1 Tax=Rhodophyticola porphyridii TaxID=1852017 RepID=A0A3L9Y579_9RHOB|nr:hypothetical protein D9R08_02925 [Rhodophyticola porphyridii]